MNNNVSISENNVGLKFLLRALRHRNYRLFFAGQGISLTGSWMQMIAVSWLTYRLTNSAFLLGLIAFTNQIPVFLLSPFGGVLADRWNRRNILIITQTLALIQALILAILSLSNVIAVWHIVILSIFIGLVNSLDMPVRQAFVVDMVKDKKDLGNAIALNSFLFNGARLIGASLAGIIIAITGEGICFLLNALSFLAVIIALQQMQIGPVEKREELIDIFKDLKEGFNYALGSTSIRYILMFVTLISVMGMSYVVIMPIFAKDIL